MRVDYYLARQVNPRCMSYCGINPCPGVPYTQEQWLQHANTECTKACLHTEPFMHTHKDTAPLAAPDPRDIADTHALASHTMCEDECRRDHRCGGVVFEAATHTCTVLSAPVRDHMHSSLAHSPGDIVSIKGHHHSACAVSSMRDVVTCEATETGLENGWDNARCQASCIDRYTTSRDECPMDACQCRKSRLPVEEYETSAQGPAERARMCCDYCVASQHLDNLECLQVRDPDEVACRSYRTTNFDSCGVCLSNMVHALAVPQAKERLRRLRHHAGRARSRVQREAARAAELRKRIDALYRRTYHSPPPGTLAGCELDLGAPGGRSGNVTHHLRRLARRHKHACRAESRAEHRLRSLRGMLREQTDETEHRESCLRQCEPTCGDAHNTKMCAHAEMRCKPGATDCTPGVCRACLETLGRAPLCSWEECTIFSQNSCLGNSCQAFMNTCRLCPAPPPTLDAEG